MRICIGLTDIGNIAETYAKGFQALGHKTFTVVWNKRQFFPDSHYDVVIDSGARRGLLVRYALMGWGLAQLARVLSCDIFILFAPAVLPTQLYYPLLKKMGKRIVTAFWGSDVRYWYAFAEEMRLLQVDEEVRPFFDYARERSGGGYYNKLGTIRTAERYSNLILSQPDCAQLQERPYMRANVPLDLSLLRFRVPDREIPLVLHAPSVPAAKGTDHVLAAVEQLKREGVNFEFRLIENMPNSQLRDLLTESDIVIDELYAATVAGLSAEGMATGNVSLVRYMPDYCKVPPGCPAVNVNMHTLLDKLRQVILDRALRRRLAFAGRPYVEANNEHIKITRQLLQWLEPGGIRQYDFVPTFYKTFRMPPELLEQERKQQWTKVFQVFRNEMFKVEVEESS